MPTDRPKVPPTSPIARGRGTPDSAASRKTTTSSASSSVSDRYTQGIAAAKRLRELEFAKLRVNFLQERCGISAEFQADWAEFDSMDTFCTVRSKPWGMLNTRNEASGRKGTNIKTKTGVRGPIYGSAYFGFLPYHKRFRFNQLRKVEKETYQIPDIDKYSEPQYVTFERQTLSAIQARIESGYYKIVTQRVDAKGVPYRIIQDRDQPPKFFMLRYDPEDFLDSTAESGRLETVEESVYREESRRRLPATKSRRSLAALIQTNSDKTIKVLTYDPDTDTVDETPHILCTKDGRPIKGDIDIQDVIMPDYYPMNAEFCAYLYIQCKNNTDLIRDILKFEAQLKASMTLENRRAYIKMLRYIKLALAHIEQNKNRPIVKEMGTLTLLKAVMILAKGQSEILHGSEGGSPLIPENMAVTFVPNPYKATDKFDTDNEFQYLQLLLNNEALLSSKVMDYNPCHLVSGTYIITDKNGIEYETNWRQDLDGRETDERFGKGVIPHPCNNKTDEIYNIKLRRLLMEKNLLEFKKAHGIIRFKTYCEILLKNFAIMRGNVAYDYQHRDELFRLMDEGARVAQKIIASVAKCTDIDQRLSEITVATNYADAANLKRSLDKMGASLRRKSTLPLWPPAGPTPSARM